MLAHEQPLPSGVVQRRASGAGGRHRIRPKNFWDALRDGLAQPGGMFGVFVSLTGSQLVSSMLGLVFWTVAARSLTAKELGFGAALVAVMAVSSIIGSLGISTLLLERLKLVSVGDQRALLSTGLTVAGIGGAVVAACWLGLLALLNVPGALGEVSFNDALLLVATTGLATRCSIFDYAAIGLGASNVQLRRNLVAAVLRIAVLFGAIGLGIRIGQVFLVSWAVACVGSLIASPLRRYLPPRHPITLGHRLRLMRSQWSAATGHHGLNLAMASSGLLLPVVAGSIMPAAPLAYFTQARLLADTILAPPFLLSVALFAAAGDTEGFRQKAPRTIVVGFALALSAIVGTALIGPFVLLLFGASYAQHSLPLLLVLVAAGPALVVKDQFFMLRRLQGKRRQGALAAGLWSAAELAGALVGGWMAGMTMLCIGWSAMSSVCALIALPLLIRAIRRPRAKPKISCAGRRWTT
jgi:O-antigen/teichoic acid export membrane protein